MLQEYYNDEYLSLKLRTIIEENKHTYSSLSRESGVSASSIRELCNPKKPFNPRLSTLKKLSKALDLDLLKELYEED